MDRDEALRLLREGILREGIKEWNRRRKSGEEIPDLRKADLRKADLRKANLHGANLMEANLYGASLIEASLDEANLMEANLRGASLIEASLDRANLRKANLTGANLFRANLIRVSLDEARLIEANLRGASLVRARLPGASLDEARLDEANLMEANLRGARLIGVSLDGASLVGASLIGAILIEASLVGASLARASLVGASLARATCGGTVFADVDLSEVEGLESVHHLGPSHVSTDTLIRSQGKIPKVFLRGCGVPDTLIDYLPSLIGSMSPSQFYSCFISYSTKDEEFASQLHNDFQATGIRCWKWDHDARTGRTIWGEIDQAIHQYDKLVLVASKASLTSPAVNREIERAIQQEDERKKLQQKGKYEGDWNVLFPVRLDDYIFKKWDHERKADVVSKVIADARKWNTDPSVYPKIRERLLRDLKAEDSTAK